MSKDVVLITGGKGMVAYKLSELLIRKGYSVRFLTRRKENESDYEWDISSRRIDLDAFRDVSHIIHLAGAGIADKTWTEERKRLIRSSRVDSAKLILETLKKNEIRIKSFISASAVGFYGIVTADVIFTEENKKGEGFLSDVCSDWEKAARQFATEGVAERTVVLRIGLVLSKKGGVLSKMVSPIRWYVGASLGRGKQYMPWIHIDDLSGIIFHILENQHLIGVYNAVAPEHIQNNKFTKMVAQKLGRPIWLPSVPSAILRLFFGDRASLLLEGNRVSSVKIVHAGYRFRYASLTKALNNMLL